MTNEMTRTGMPKQRGASLIELIMFIVIVSVALAGILLVMNVTTRGSADPLIHKQALAIAESLLEEVELMPFTFCDPDDATAATATGPGECTTRVEGIGLDTAFGAQPANETRYSATSPFDNVNDYNGCQLNAAANSGCDVPGNGGIKDITDTVIAGLGGYRASVTVGGSLIPAIGAAPEIAATESLQITVSVTGPDNVAVVLDGIRTRYAPRAVP